ncbi:MAG: hypothetical protein L6R40_003218 [Gallowayella cf. fulva]|nr:MAG: hypothetical protein L6R40_003218 [Xanthomendoza cf. fulva]
MPSSHKPESSRSRSSATPSAQNTSHGSRDLVSTRSNHPTTNPEPPRSRPSTNRQTETSRSNNGRTERESGRHAALAPIEEATVSTQRGGPTEHNPLALVRRNDSRIQRSSATGLTDQFDSLSIAESRGARHGTAQSSSRQSITRYTLQDDQLALVPTSGRNGERSTRGQTSSRGQSQTREATQNQGMVSTRGQTSTRETTQYQGVVSTRGQTSTRDATHNQGAASTRGATSSRRQTSTRGDYSPHGDDSPDSSDVEEIPRNHRSSWLFTTNANTSTNTLASRPSRPSRMNDSDEEERVFQQYMTDLRRRVGDRLDREERMDRELRRLIEAYEEEEYTASLSWSSRRDMGSYRRESRMRFISQRSARGSALGRRQLRDLDYETCRRYAANWAEYLGFSDPDEVDPEDMDDYAESWALHMEVEGVRRHRRFGDSYGYY